MYTLDWLLINGVTAKMPTRYCTNLFYIGMINMWVVEKRNNLRKWIKMNAQVLYLIMDTSIEYTLHQVACADPLWSLTHQTPVKRL